MGRTLKALYEPSRHSETTTASSWPLLKLPGPIIPAKLGANAMGQASKRARGDYLAVCIVAECGLRSDEIAASWTVSKSGDM